jgi:hypothetical protein
MQSAIKESIVVSGTFKYFVSIKTGHVELRAGYPRRGDPPLLFSIGSCEIVTGFLHQFQISSGNDRHPRAGSKAARDYIITLR